MSFMTCAGVLPAEPPAERPFRMPAGATPAEAADVDRNTVSIFCDAACTSESRTSISAAGVESANSSFEQTEIAPTFNGVRLTVEPLAELAGMPFDSPTK